jgi:hypothetical protein
MDGRRALTIGLLAVAVWMVGAAGCAELDPTPDPLPFELYDSPVIASADSEATPPKRLPPAEQAADDEAIAETSEESDSSGEEAGHESAVAATEPESPTDQPKSSSGEPEETSEDDSPPALSTTAQTETDSTATDQTPGSDARTRSDRSPPETSDGSNIHADAARYVSAIYELNDVRIPADARTDIPTLYRHCREKDATFQSSEPKPGDLVFFHNLEDANGDGRNNDWYTFVGLVERVRNSGTVSFLGYRDGEVRSYTMNLQQPDTPRSGGQTVNSKLRPESSDDPPFTQHLAGQLFAGYCSLLGDRSELLVVDNWEPGMELEKPE